MSFPRLRRLFLDVHLWLGAGLALLLIPLGITGSALVYRPAIERWMAAGKYPVTGSALLAPSAYLQAASTAEPRLRPSQLRFPQHAGDPVTVLAIASTPNPDARPQMRSLLLDPPTGVLLAETNPTNGVFGPIHQFHESLMVRGKGRQLVGWLGIAMTLSCLTGLYLWWPRGSFLKGLRWRRGASLYSHLHHLAGFWILVPLTALSVTGIYISFPQTARALTQMAAPMSPQTRRGPRGAQPLTRPRTDIDTATRSALNAAPGSALNSITLPTETRGNASAVWRIAVTRNGATQTLEIDDATSSVRFPPAPAVQPGDAFARLMRSLHEGEGLGPVWKALVFLTGLAPALLAITGIVIWLRRKALRAARTAATN